MNEQQESNKRIQDILLSILDDETLKMFDDLFKEENPVQQETIQEEEEEEDLPESRGPVEDETGDESKNGTHSVCQSTAMSLKPESARLPSGLFLESERNQTAMSIVSTYDDEMNLYLASLPLDVRDEDLLNVQADPLRLFEKPLNTKPSLLNANAHVNKKVDVVEPSTEEKYAKNLHLFCMVEHERRNLLLLPEELINVTRKLHTKNKYDNVRKQIINVFDFCILSSLFSYLSD